MPASDSNDVWFYSLLGDSPTLNPNKVEISLTGGSLVMTTYAYASGSAPNWVFSPTASSAFTLLQYAQPIPLHTGLPVFRLWIAAARCRATAYSDSPNLGSNAANTDEVEVNFAQIRPTTGLR